ncbi:MAG: hypothetical protein ACO1N3_01165 [Gammaproteobacteria bacterium]
MAQLQISDPLTTENVINILETDLATISSMLQPGSTETLELLSTEVCISKLKDILKLANEMPDKKKSDETKKLLRHFIFLLTEYPDKLIASTSSVHSMKLHKTINSISDTIGVTPRLNAHITLPPVDCLPAKIDTSKTRWKEIKCPNPSRTANTIATGKIDFLKRDGENSVRTCLKRQLRGQKLATVQTGSQEYYLNIADQEYYQVGLLDADHLSASSSIIARQKEMIEMMNYDPAFREEMIRSRFNDGYFIRTGNPMTPIVGSYWFYQSHHNAMQNLWFLLSSDNSGGEKVAMDPIEWLESQEIGREYLDNLRQQGKKIDKNGIFYVISPDGQGLKDSFIQWAEEDNHRLLKLCNLFAHFHHEIRADTKRIIDSGARHRSTPEVRVTLEMTKKRVLTRDDDDNSLSSGDTDQQNEIVNGAIAILNDDLEYQEMRKKMSAKESNAVEQSKKRVAYGAGARPRSSSSH